MTPLPIFDLGQVASTAVLDQLREGIIVSDERGSIRYVNEAARVMHGVAELDVVPEDYSERYHLFTIEGEPYPPEKLPLAQAVGGATVVDAPWVIRRPDGSDVHAIGTAKPLLGENGEQVGAVLTIRDESETNRTRGELRDSEDTVRAFFETAGLYTAVIDLTGDDFEFVMGNSRMAAALGVETLKGQSGTALLGEERADGVSALLRTAALSDDPTILEFPWREETRDRWFVSTVTRMHNARRRLFVATLDISDRKAAERDLATALATKDLLLHEVNHRVKNSLQIISSLLKLQERAADDEVTTRLREARGRVETVARVHERLYDTDAHDRVEIIAYLEDLLSHVVASVGHRDGISFDFSHSGGRFELGVETSIPLALIMVEMAINSAKYAYGSGDTGTVSVSTEIAGERLRMAICNDGEGVKSAANPESSSLGQRIVSALAAQLNVETTYLPADRGTYFELTMPLAAKAATS